MSHAMDRVETSPSMSWDDALGLLDRELGVGEAILGEVQMKQALEATPSPPSSESRPVPLQPRDGQSPPTHSTGRKSGSRPVGGGQENTPFGLPHLVAQDTATSASSAAVEPVVAAADPRDSICSEPGLLDITASAWGICEAEPGPMDAYRGCMAEISPIFASKREHQQQQHQQQPSPSYSVHRNAAFRTSSSGPGHNDDPHADLHFGAPLDASPASTPIRLSPGWSPQEQQLGWTGSQRLPANAISPVDLFRVETNRVFLPSAPAPTAAPAASGATEVPSSFYGSYSPGASDEAPAFSLSPQGDPLGPAAAPFSSAACDIGGFDDETTQLTGRGTGSRTGGSGASGAGGGGGGPAPEPAQAACGGPKDPASRQARQAWRFVDWAEGRAPASPYSKAAQRPPPRASSPPPPPPGAAAAAAAASANQEGGAAAEEAAAKAPRRSSASSNAGRPAPGWFRLVAGNKQAERLRSTAHLALCKWSALAAAERRRTSEAEALREKSLRGALQEVLLRWGLLLDSWLRWTAAVRERRAAEEATGRLGTSSGLGLGVLRYGCLGWGLLGGPRALLRLSLRCWKEAAEEQRVARLAFGDALLRSDQRRLFRQWHEASQLPALPPVDSALLERCLRAWRHHLQQQRLLERAVSCAYGAAGDRRRLVRPAWLRWRGAAHAQRRFKARALAVFQRMNQRRMVAAFGAWRLNAAALVEESAEDVATGDRKELGAEGEGEGEGACSSEERSQSTQGEAEETGVPEPSRSWSPTESRSGSLSALSPDTDASVSRQAAIEAWSYPSVRSCVAPSQPRRSSAAPLAVPGKRRGSSAAAVGPRASASSSPRQQHQQQQQQSPQLSGSAAEAGQRRRPPWGAASPSPSPRASAAVSYPVLRQASPSPRTPAAPVSAPLLLSPPGPLGSIISGGGGNKAPTDGATLEEQAAVEAREKKEESRMREGTDKEEECRSREATEEESRSLEATEVVEMVPKAGEEGRLTEETTEEVTSQEPLKEEIRSPEATEEADVLPNTSSAAEEEGRLAEESTEEEVTSQEPLKKESRSFEATEEVEMLPKAAEDEGRLTEEASEQKEERAPEEAPEATNEEKGKGAVLPEAAKEDERLPEPETGPGSSSAPSDPTPSGPQKQHQQEPPRSEEAEEVARLRAELRLLQQEANSKIAEGNARVLRLRGTVAALARGHSRQRQRMAASAAFATWRRLAAPSSLSLVPYGNDTSSSSSNAASPAQEPLDEPLPTPPAAAAAANPPSADPSPPQRHLQPQRRQKNHRRPPTPPSEVPRYAKAPPQGGGSFMSPADSGRSPLSPAASGTGYSSCSSNSRPPPLQLKGPSRIPSPHLVQRQQQQQQQHQPQQPLQTTKLQEEQSRADSPFTRVWETAELDSLEQVVW